MFKQLEQQFEKPISEKTFLFGAYIIKAPLEKIDALRDLILEMQEKEGIKLIFLTRDTRYLKVTPE